MKFLLPHEKENRINQIRYELAYLRFQKEVDNRKVKELLIEKETLERELHIFYEDSITQSISI